MTTSLIVVFFFNFLVTVTAMNSYNNGNLKGKWSESGKVDFESFVRRAMEDLHVPGAAVAVINREGQFLYRRAFGKTCASSNTLVKDDTCFMIGSMTKPLAAFSLLSMSIRESFPCRLP